MKFDKLELPLKGLKLETIQWIPIQKMYKGFCANFQIADPLNKLNYLYTV